MRPRTSRSRRRARRSARRSGLRCASSSGDIPASTRPRCSFEVVSEGRARAARRRLRAGPRGRASAGRGRGGSGCSRAAIEEGGQAAEARALVARIVDDARRRRGRVDVDEGETRSSSPCSGPDVALLIGRHGQTIDAVQYLLNVIALPRVRRGEEGRRGRRGRVPRAPPRDARDARPDEIADRVRESGEPEELEPMTSVERKVVHLRLKEVAGVATDVGGHGAESLRRRPSRLTTGSRCSRDAGPDGASRSGARARDAARRRAARGAAASSGFDGPLIDVGSGGGSPGIPLAAALPDREVTLLDAERRKCDFLRRWAPPNAQVVWGRAEEQPVEHFGVALAKALAQPPVAAEWCLPLVRVGGAALLWLGERADLDAARGGRGATRRRPSRAARRPRRAAEDRSDAARLSASRRRREEASAGLATMAAAMSRVYALANQKGGVGKTTTAVNLAACLAEAGQRALVIDLDPQANATSGLGMRANGTSSYDLLDGAPLAELIEHTAFANLDLVPAKPDLAGAVVELAGRSDGERYLVAGARVGQRRVRLRLPRLPAVARPAHGQRARRGRSRARAGAGGVLRARGPRAAHPVVELIRRRLNPNLGIGGLLLTMVDGRTRLAAQVEEEVRRHFGDARLPHVRAALGAPRRGAEPRPARDCLRPSLRRSRRLLEGGDGACRARLSPLPASRSRPRPRGSDRRAPRPERAARDPRRRDSPEPAAAAPPLRGGGGVGTRRLGAPAGRDPAAPRPAARRRRLRDRRRRAPLAGGA